MAGAQDYLSICILGTMCTLKNNRDPENFDERWFDCRSGGSFFDWPVVEGREGRLEVLLPLSHKLRMHLFLAGPQGAAQ